MQIREQRQNEAKKSYLSSNRKTVIAACPRFGKIKTTIEIIKEKYLNKKILLLYPRVDILTSWFKDFEFWNIENPLYHYSTFVGMKKLTDEYDLVIVDEIHEMSRAQLNMLHEKFGCDILGLSGTITAQTRLELAELAGLTICYDYPISKGVEEGILTDYKIIIHKVPLDKEKKQYQKNTSSEKQYFDKLSWTRSKSSKKFFFDLKLIKILQDSLSRRKETRRLLKNFQNQRVLVFCGNTTVANDLEIDVYHSKAKDKKLFDEFCNGERLHLAVVKMAQAGVTVKPINIGLINYTSGNPEDFAQKVCRFLGFEYNNPTKTAELHILCSDEPFERNRLNTALAFFDKNKIIWKE
jgi:superfamily II DNA or RNA helicase